MNECKSRVLLADSGHGPRQGIDRILLDGGFAVTQVQTGAELLLELSRSAVDLVLYPVDLEGAAGFELLQRVKRQAPDLPVVVISSKGTVKLAVEAMKHGAADFIAQPFDPEEILFALRKALEVSERVRDSVPEPDPTGHLLLANSPVMAQVQAIIERAAPTPATVLIRGEGGTGKDLVAHAIHARSQRAAGPLVRVNCAAIPEALLESELFGSERGAFTGATSRPGRVELAEGGTLFLDEIGDIGPTLQSKLLRLLQNREYDRLGGSKMLTADVRFVAATSRNLERMMKAGEFRQDLFFRLNVVPIRLPPLRERAEDIERLARHFCAEVARINGRPETKLDQGAIDLLRKQRWRGNVRELQNFIERLVILSEGPVLGPVDVQRELEREPAISTATQPTAASGTLEERVRAAERDALVSALARTGDNRVMAARLLGVSRRTLYAKLNEHDLV